MSVNPVTAAWTFARRNAVFLLWLTLALLLAATQTGMIFIASLALGLGVLGMALFRLPRLLLNRSREAVLNELVRLLLLALACAVVWGITQWREAQLRTRADAVVAAIWQWQQQHQRFPPDLAALGLPRPQSAHEAHYRLSPNGPHLFYRSAWLAYDTWFYDFETRQWQYMPD